MSSDDKSDDDLKTTDWRETPENVGEDPVDPNTRNRNQDEANSHQGDMDITPPKGERAPGLNK